jgi:hypothetical protein
MEGGTNKGQAMEEMTDRKKKYTRVKLSRL